MFCHSQDLDGFRLHRVYSSRAGGPPRPEEGRRVLVKVYSYLFDVFFCGRVQGGEGNLS